MKKYLILIASAIILFCLASCQKEVAQATLSVDPVSVYFTPEASSQVVTVTSNANWTATSAEPWISIVPANDGNTFLISVDENSAPEGSRAGQRFGTVVVTAGEKSVSISVSQGKEYEVFRMLGDVFPSQFPEEGGTLHVKILSNVDYTISGTTDWLHLAVTKAPAQDEYLFIVDPNPIRYYRDATLLFKSADGVTKAVYVNQGAKLKGKYTIMCYGASGSGVFLDHELVANLMDVMNLGISDDIKVVCEYNFDPTLQGDYCTSGTSRLVVRNSNLQYDEKLGNNVQECALFNLEDAIQAGGIEVAQVVDEKPIDLTDPENIADFINWSFANAPSENYILLVTGHGSGWYPADDKGHTKANAWDDNNPDVGAITAKDLVEGIKLSGHGRDIKLLIQESCLMNRMENIAEYADTGIQYALLTFQTARACEYGYLAEYLMKDVSFETAITTFAEKYPKPDYTLWDLNKVDNVLVNIAIAMDGLKADYVANMDTYNEWINKLRTVTYTKEGEPLKDIDSKDFYMFWCQLAEKALDADLKEEANNVKEAMEDATLGTWFSKDLKLSPYQDFCKCSALFYNKDTYAQEKKEYGEAVFKENRFYYLTEWNSMFDLFTIDN